MIDLQQIHVGDQIAVRLPRLTVTQIVGGGGVDFPITATVDDREFRIGIKEVSGHFADPTCFEVGQRVLAAYTEGQWTIIAIVKDQAWLHPESGDYDRVVGLEYLSRVVE